MPRSVAPAHLQCQGDEDAQRAASDADVELRLPDRAVALGDDGRALAAGLVARLLQRLQWTLQVKSKPHTKGSCGIALCSPI